MNQMTLYDLSLAPNPTTANATVNILDYFSGIYGQYFLVVLHFSLGSLQVRAEAEEVHNFILLGDFYLRKIAGKEKKSTKLNIIK